MPIGLGTAIVGAAVVGAGASVIASSSASSAATKAADKNNALQTDVYNQNKEALAPFQQTGAQAGTALNSLLGLNGADNGSAAFGAYKGSTEYQSRLQQGQNTVTAALGGKGLLDSGAAQKSLLKYGQTFASNEFGNYAANLQNQQNVGLSAASAQAGVGQNYANAVSANNTNAANTVGNAALSGANSINGVLGAAVGAYGYSKGYGSSYGGKNTSVLGSPYSTPPIYGGNLGGIY